LNGQSSSSCGEPTVRVGLHFLSVRLFIVTNKLFSDFVDSLGQARLVEQPLRQSARIRRPENESEGYAAQAELAEWFKEHGEGEVGGYKIGATAQSMQTYLGVTSPVYGHIMSGNVLRSGAEITGERQCVTGVECELAVYMASDLDPSYSTWTRDRVVDLVGAVAPAIEIVENRYGDFRSTGIGVLVADDFFHKACVVGAPIYDWQQIDLAAISARITVDGEHVGEGSGKAILGHPLEAVAWLANKLAEHECALKAGDVILTGSMTPVFWLDRSPSAVEIQLSDVGSCAVRLLPR